MRSDDNVVKIMTMNALLIKIRTNNKLQNRMGKWTFNDNRERQGPYYVLLLFVLCVCGCDTPSKNNLPFLDDDDEIIIFSICRFVALDAC